MSVFTINIGIGLVWMLVSGEWSVVSYVEGFAVGYGILWLTARSKENRGYFRRVPMSVSFAFFFLYELVLSNIRIAVDILRRHPKMSPSIIAVPLDARTDLEIVLLANLLTLTPGTLSLDVSEDRKTLYVHVVYGADPKAVVDEIKKGFERRVLELCR